MAVTKTTISKPKITLPTNYSLTLSEGEVVKITGTSENIHDYKIIYAKRRCDVAKAVEGYNSANGYYAATATDLKNKLLANVSNDVSYYVLKDFDADSTFISQDQTDKKSFYIRTPSTNEMSVINDFYVLQWFKDVEPGDLVYIYAIERGTVKVTEPGETVTKTISCIDWRCRCCDSVYYGDFWYRYDLDADTGYSPYTKVDLSGVDTFFKQYSSCTFSATLTFGLSRTCSGSAEILYQPPVILLANKRLTMSNDKGAIQNLDFTTANNKYVFNVPVTQLKNMIAQGYAYAFFNSRWGQNRTTKIYFIDIAKLTLTATKPAVQSSEIGYSDGKYNSINEIPLSDMTPYVVIPPAVKPLELVLKDVSSKEATISYTNPLYGNKANDEIEHTNVGSVYINVKTGNDKNDLSDLNAQKDANGIEVQLDNTLNLSAGEKRLITYEKRATLSSSILNSIKSSNSSYAYMDLDIVSADSNRINFTPITNKDIKLQVMFSKAGKNKTRVFDFDSSLIDTKLSEYSFKKLMLDRAQIVNNGFDTVHLLYNISRYDNGKAYNTTDWQMSLPGGGSVASVGWRMIGSNPGRCTFVSETYEVKLESLKYNKYKLRLCLENLSASKPLFAPPKITAQRGYRLTYTDPEISDNPMTKVLTPITTGEIPIGSDIYYDIPIDLFDITYNGVITYTMETTSPYPLDLPDITFSNAYVELISVSDVNENINKYAAGFNATATFFTEKTNVNNSANSVSVFDPVQCIDVIMCCYDENKNLINKSNSNRRDIYNGKELVYYTDRQWHSFVNDKYKNHIKYKQSYDMIFTVPNNTEYMFFIAFCYSNWKNNPSIYSMSNILSSSSVTQDFSLSFINPVPTINELTGEEYTTVGISNPNIGIKVNAKKSGNVNITDNVLNNGFNLAKDKFNRSKWLANPIVYSNTKKYGYELPIFNSASLYIPNNVVSSLEPLYNDIEFYNKWANLYGKEIVSAPIINNNGENNKNNNSTNDLIEIESSYTVFEDEGDKFIANNAVPYINIPAEIASYDRSKITLFLDANFGLETAKEEENKYKLVTEVYEETYQMTQFRGYWGVKTLWTSKMMESLMDVASIEDIKIEWGMKLRSGVSVPTSGIKGPVLVEDLWVDSDYSYNYTPTSKYPEECSANRIREREGQNITFVSTSEYYYYEIKSPRLKRLFLECNCHRRRHDAIIFENFESSGYWDRTVKVRFTVTRKVYHDGTKIYKRQNLPSAHYGSDTWVPGWATYSMSNFKTDNERFTKLPTDSDPSFIMTYDLYLSPVVFYYKNNMTSGDSLGNKYKYTWGDNENAYMKWETFTVQGTAPCTITKTHYYIAYESKNVVTKTFAWTISTDGTITLKQQ